MLKCLVIGFVVFALPAVALASDDPIFDVEALASTPLRPRTSAPASVMASLPRKCAFTPRPTATRTLTSSHIFPTPKARHKLPAFIWNPGGLGQASPGYTQPPARRGYAVLCIDFPQPGYRSTGDYPINRTLELGADPRQAPIYHGAVALIKAVSFLASRAGS